ncbi:hypothetical protein Sjap_015931 [Stephania japonica]|uniref:Uncharacterized protein n=1 Tax=Stephania japonica TaxID=461633 RepID=A0AAP0IK31_9MAGN
MSRRIDNLEAIEILRNLNFIDSNSNSKVMKWRPSLLFYVHRVDDGLESTREIQIVIGGRVADQFNGSDFVSSSIIGRGTVVARSNDAFVLLPMLNSMF